MDYNYNLNVGKYKKWIDIFIGWNDIGEKHSRNLIGQIMVAEAMGFPNLNNPKTYLRLDKELPKVRVSN